MWRRAAGAALVEQHDAISVRVVETPHLLAATGARATVEHHHRLSVGIAALLEVDGVTIIDLQCVTVEWLDLGVQLAQRDRALGLGRGH